jgi:hypothetical protein
MGKAQGAKSSSTKHRKENTQSQSRRRYRKHSRGSSTKPRERMHRESRKHNWRQASSSSGSKSTPNDDCDAGVGGTRRGGAKQREDGEERGVKDSDYEQTGKKRKCEEPVNEHVREKIKRYKTMPDRGEGRIEKMLETQVQERPWRRARKRERQDGEESDSGTSGTERPRVKKKERTVQRNVETSRHSARTLISLAAYA